MSESLSLIRQRRDQMLKLVAKGFYRELVNYGVEQAEILSVASNLLDNLTSPEGRAQGPLPVHDQSLHLGLIQDSWKTQRSIIVGDIILRPLALGVIPKLSSWLEDPKMRACFITPFPNTPSGWQDYLSSAHQSYLAIEYGGETVGFIGGESIDRKDGKLEMKKCVGRDDLRGHGIGKRATFGFLYYAFMILGVHKVYIHSRDINIRNINLNSRLGFEVEGVFLEDLVDEGARQDVVRMALLRPVWEQLFAAPV